MRINQFIAKKLNYSRRQADRLIVAKKVKINNRVAVLGDRVDENDKVLLNNKLVCGDKELFYLLFNKPIGIVSNLAHDKSQKGIKDILKYPNQVFPVGRLDKESHGLIILTNDSRITEKLLHPSHQHEKEYVVLVDKKITEDFLKQLRNGVDIDGYKTKKTYVKKITPKKFKITLTEGKNRQIRRMCESLGYKVLDLKRIRILNLKLDNLKPGEYKELRGKKLKEFLEELKIA